MQLVEAEFVVAYLLALRLLCVGPNLKNFLRMQNWLEEAKQCSLLGRNILQHASAQESVDDGLATKSLDDLRELSIQARLRGESITLSLRNVQVHLGAAVRYAKESHHLFITLCIKIAIVTSLAFLGRAAVLFYLSQTSHLEKDVDDRILLGIGLILVNMLLFYIKRRLPKPWLWQQGFTPLGKTWLMKEFSAGGELPSWWGEAWHNLNDKEFFLGIDLTADKTMLLQDWVHHLESEQSLRMTIFESALPLLEIVIAGGLALVILLHPILLICHR
jgi:hypothetical protein